MTLTELAEYAKRTYDIDEQHKWEDFPGFSVLCHPRTGKWIALLMRQWDTESGTEIQCCDIKCGPHSKPGPDQSWLSAPIRMHGKNWIGARIDSATDEEAVFSLLDSAVSFGEAHGTTMILDSYGHDGTNAYQETPLPFGARAASKRSSRRDRRENRRAAEVLGAPERIQEMIRLYEHGSSRSMRARNFYVQGSFMEDYEDNAPWNGTFSKYYPTYHDLNIPQLRGYFTWRAGARRGVYGDIPESMAYIYVYELLCGIGTSSPEDALSKLTEFEKGYAESTPALAGMQWNISQWKFEFAVLHGLSVNTIMQYADPAVRESDSMKEVLKEPEHYTDDEVFSALSFFAGSKLRETLPVKRKGEAAVHWLAQMWRFVTHTSGYDAKDMFTLLFGEMQTAPWHPLANAVYWEAYPDCVKDTEIVLNSVRSYQMSDGQWTERCCIQDFMGQRRMLQFMHAADRLMREEFRTGGYLKERADELWAVPIIEAFRESERRKEAAAAAPEIRIDFSELAQIREDAGITRDSLLTADESERDEHILFDDRTTGGSDENAYGEMYFAEPVPADQRPAYRIDTLDQVHLEILSRLLAGKPVDDVIKANHLLPSVAADAINEAFFDQLDDNAVDWDGNTVLLVEDYADEIAKALDRARPRQS